VSSPWEEDVVLILERVFMNVGHPKRIRVDQGSEFISGDFGVSKPDKPTDNSFKEFFNGRFRAECLNAKRLAR
jgi:putative transposase